MEKPHPYRPFFTRGLPTSNVFLAAVGTAGLLRAPSASKTSLNAELNDQRSSDLRGKPLRIRALNMARPNRCSVLFEPWVQWEMDPQPKIRLVFLHKLGSFGPLINKGKAVPTKQGIIAARG